MTTWSEVEFVASEDTACLDSVSREDNGSGLYQVDTLVKISAANEAQGNPRLSSCSGSNWSIVIADKTVALFDQSFQTILLLLHFETDVDAFNVCRERQFLVVCERNGNIHFFYVPYKKKLFTKNLVEKPCRGDKKTFCSLIIDEDKASAGIYHMFLLMNNGFFHIANLDLAKIETAFEKMDVGALKELQSLINIDFCSMEDDSCSTAVMLQFGQEIHLVIGGGEDNVLTRWKMDPRQSKMYLADTIDDALIPGVKKMVVAENRLYILNTEDILSLWDLQFLVMIHCWPDLVVHDFELTTECGSASTVGQDKDSMRIITLTKSDQNQISSLQIRFLPSMTAYYSLDVSSVSCLVNTRVNMDTIYLVEGIYENTKSCGEPINSVVVRCFTEALPENRLSRLLHKHMFEEAEKFAITFELDLELVYKVKLDFVLEQLASASVGGYGQDMWSELVDEAKTNLMKITDEQYVVDYCLKAPWPSFETAVKMLNHAASRYSCSQIHEAMARLDTFYSLHGSENFNGIAWIEFLNSTDNLGDVLAHLRDGDMRGAQLLWLRSEGQIAAEFDESRLEALLGAIPQDLPSQQLCPWFRTALVPFLRRVLPEGQKILAKWLEQKARYLELTERSAWPQNGLDLATLGLPSLWTRLKSDINGAEEVENLKSLVSNLCQLLDVQRKYKCKLSLSVFEKRTVWSLAFFMLDKVPAPELIAATVENCINPYAEEHNLSLDELLLQYIKDLLARCSSQTTTLFTEWEAKAVAVHSCMTDTDLMVDAVLAIMQKAVVPWTKDVENLVQQYLEMDGPKQELLNESYHLMEIRKLLSGYGIRNVNLSTSSQIMTLIRYILKQDLQTSLEDALILAKGYKLPTSQIYYLYLIQLTGQGKIEEILTVLKKLSSAEAECVIERLTTWAWLQLEDKHHISEEHKKHQMIISQVMVEALKYLHIIQKYDTLKSMACENNLVMFKAISHLQEDFDVFFTPSNYEDPTIRKQIQEHHITAYENTRGCRPSDGKPIKSSMVANDPDGKTKTISTEAGLRRLGRQLQRTEQELWSDLALRALEAGKVDKALKILSELYEHHCNSNTGKVLFNAAKMLCQMLEADMPMVLPEGMDLPAVIHDLACQAITVCDSDLLLDCLELCKCTRIAMDVYHQCQLSDNYGFVAMDFNVTEKDSYSQWSFQDGFHEDCIVLDPASVLPIQYEITNCLLPISHDAKLYPLDCSCLSHHSFVNGSNRLQPLVGPLTTMLRMLQECTQLELAMRVLVNSYGSCLQHVTSNVMNMKLSVKLYDSQELQQYNACLSELRKTTITFLSSVAIALLNKVFNWRVVDCDLAIGLCTLLPKAEVFKILWKVIDNTWQNYDKISAVAKVGADLCCLFNEAQEQKKFHSVITDAEWGIKLGKLEISIQPVFRQRPELKSSLIPDMVKNSRVTPDIVLQYCSTFGLDRDNVINQYITTLLLLQEDEEGGAGDLASCQDAGPPLCHADALDQVLQIIPMLNTTSELTDSLCTSIFKLSPYNYERIEVVLTIIHAADENVTIFPVRQAMALLQHLRSYERVSPPSDVENSYLFENGLLPNPLSRSRLPFHLLIQTKHYWKIISPELSEETFPTLLLISKLMKMSLDKLYMSAANHVFEKKMKPLLFEQRKKGQGHGYNKETFKVAKTMMHFIRCIQNPEFAAATAYSVTQELPPGFGRTQYLRFCLALGEAWLKDSNLDEASRAKAETYLSKLKLQFQRSATENALIANELNSPEHQKLTGLPTRLIAALYEHSSVEQRYKETGVQTFPDVHAAVKEIAAINNIDLMKICHIMLEKWICKTGPAVAKEIGNPDCVDNIEDDPDLMRVVYMLQSFPMDDAVQLLNPILSAETWPLRSSGPRLTFCHQTRVLLCLVRLVDAATLETRLQIPKSSIQYHLKCYIFVSQLEALNIPYTVRSFLSSPKEGLIKGLWKNHSHEPQAVQLVADLCLEYKVYDPQLLNSLLQRLLGFNLISHLQKVLETIVTVPALWEMSSLCKAWRTITVGSLIKVCLPLDSCELEKLYRSFVLLTKCPFLLSLDLRGIASDYEKVELYAFALGALCFISCVKTREHEIKAFLSANNPVTVLDQVEEHMETGQLAGIPSKVRDCALDFICRQGLQSTVLNTRHFTHLKDFVVSCGNAETVKELADSLISENRQDEADEVDSKFKSLQRVKKEKC